MKSEPSTVEEKVDFLSIVQPPHTAELQIMINNIKMGRPFNESPTNVTMSTDDQEEYYSEAKKVANYIYAKWYDHLKREYDEYSSHPEDHPYFSELERFLKDPQQTPEIFAASAADVIDPNFKSYPNIHDNSPLFDLNGYMIYTDRFLNTNEYDTNTEIRIYLSPNTKDIWNIAKLLIDESENTGVPIKFKLHDMSSTDSFVIYSNYHEVSKIIGIIKHITKARPEFFEKSNQLIGYGKVDDGIYIGEEVPDVGTLRGHTTYSGLRKDHLQKMFAMREKTIAQVILDGELFTENKGLLKDDSPREIKKLISNASFINMLLNGYVTDYFKKMWRKDTSISIKTQEDLDRYVLAMIRELGIAGPDVENLNFNITDRNRAHIYASLGKYILFAGREPKNYQMVYESIMNELMKSPDVELQSIAKNPSYVSLITLQYYQNLILKQEKGEITPLFTSLDRTLFCIFGKQFPLEGVGTQIYKSLTKESPPKSDTSKLSENHIPENLHIAGVNAETVQELLNAGYDITKIMGTKSIDDYLLEHKKQRNSQFGSN